MRLEVWHVGKTKESWADKGITAYTRKISRYAAISEIIIKEERSKTPSVVRQKESERILTKLQQSQGMHTILLDERGKLMNSIEFSGMLEHCFMHRGPSVRFISGGPFGVTEEVRKEADALLALSPMVFPHDLVRLILLEQLYRAFTILRGESYHHI